MECEKRMSEPWALLPSLEWFAHPCRGLSKAGKRKWPTIPTSSSSIPGYRPPESPVLRPRPGSSLPDRQGAGPDHRAEAGTETVAQSDENRRAVEVASGPSQITQPSSAARVEDRLEY